MLLRVNPRIWSANVRYRRDPPDGLPIPPDDLIFLVAGTPEISWFLRIGALAADGIRSLLAKHGANIEQLDAILDFGCGSGRVTRHWHHLRETKIYGVDYNERLIQWCSSNLGFAKFSANQLHPPLIYGDARFDLIYALSVFTHLTEDLQLAWIEELSRVLKPGGFLYLTTHGKSYSYRLSRRERERFDAGELVVKNDTRRPGTNPCSAYHPTEYLQGTLGQKLTLIDWIPEGAMGNPHQDVVLFRK
jgi:SAM-dependent methyltransferase